MFYIKSQRDWISPGSSPLERRHWSREVTPPARFQLLDTSSNTSSPPALLQVCPNSTPNSLYSPGDLLLFYFIFLQPNKAGFYLGSVTLSAILGITWRPHTPQQQQKNLLLAFPQQKSTAESRHLSAPTFKKQENPKKTSPNCVVLTTYGRNSDPVHPELLSS